MWTEEVSTKQNGLFYKELCSHNNHDDNEKRCDKLMIEERRHVTGQNHTYSEETIHSFVILYLYDLMSMETSNSFWVKIALINSYAYISCGGHVSYIKHFVVNQFMIRRVTQTTRTMNFYDV